MNIKIGPSKITGTDALQGQETKELQASAPAASSDPVTEIATDLLSGNITSDEAVDRLIAHTMDTEMVGSAPEALRKEVEEALRTAIETDPYLKSLATGLE